MKKFSKKTQTLNMDSMTHEIVNGMMMMSDLLKPINEAVDAYRHQALERGYSAEASEQLAVTYHAFIFNQMTQGKN
ncbi:hypothetical protein [Nocardiopsis alba]|uniref:hypothetical protein n=1 Tax=Nocardiopsis alba TaxID=53437 RepID=UPI0033B83D7F